MCTVPLGVNTIWPRVWTHSTAGVPPGYLRHSFRTSSQGYGELINSRMLMHRSWLAFWPGYVPHCDAVIFKQHSCGLARKRRRVALCRRWSRRFPDAECDKRKQRSRNALFVISANQYIT